MFWPLTLALMLFSFFQRLITRGRLFVSSRLGAWVNSFGSRSAWVLPLGVLVLALVLLVFYGAQSSSTQRYSRSQPPSIANEIRAGEIRGVWMTNVASGILFTPWGISRALNQLAAMDFNTVYPVVWNRGQTFYRSPTLKKLTGQTIDPLIALLHPQEDPLAEMVRVGHRKQLRVMPWFEYGFMVPMNSALAQQHPEWLTSRQNGSRQLTEGALAADSVAGQKSGDVAGKARPLARPLNSGAPAHLGWLNPMHPSVQGLLLGLIEEVIEAYDVDGIQLDDHFSLPVEFGYDAYTLSLYEAEHQGQSPPSNPADPDWIRWRARKLSKFMNVLHARVKAKCDSLGRPRDRCTVSISPNPAKFAYRFQLQDWRSWVQQGWVDELVVQVYRDDLARFESELSKGPLLEAKERIPVSIGILTGTWRHPIAFEQIQQQVRSSRDRQFAGISFFYWDTLWSYFTPEAPQQRRQAFKQLMDE
jgi:uncharacterized lipoprotein YddW (UPF0748 family)